MKKKKQWTTPKLTIDTFTPDESISACITGTLQCQFPGDGTTNGQEKFDDYNGRSSGWWYEDTEHKMPHGICGYDQTVTFTSDGPKANEANGRSVYNIQGYEDKVGTYYGVTWNSFYGSEYSHKGRLVITDIDTKHPNHS